MAKQRFVLRYRGEGAKPEVDVARVRELADVDVIESSSRMLLVESEREPLQHLVDGLADWIMGPDVTYDVPDTRKDIIDPQSSSTFRTTADERRGGSHGR